MFDSTSDVKLMLLCWEFKHSSRVYSWSLLLTMANVSSTYLNQHLTPSSISVGITFFSKESITKFLFKIKSIVSSVGMLLNINSMSRLIRWSFFFRTYSDSLFTESKVSRSINWWSINSVGEFRLSILPNYEC